MDANNLKLVESNDNRFSAIVLSELSEVEQASLVSIALQIMQSKHQRGACITSPVDTRKYLQLYLGERRNEAFGCIYLDNRNRVIAIEELFQGTIDGASVYPRNVVEQTLAWNAAAVIFFHNHPSGATEPSQADIVITKRLKDALGLINVRVLDHHVVSATSTVSFAERGLI